MLVGCYSLDAYCSNQAESYEEETKIHGHYNPWPIQYTGNTLQDCVRQARKDGWKVGRERHLCPVCTGKNPDFLKRR